jgi:hypothetical protein
MVNAKSLATKSIAVASAVALTVAAVVPLLTSSAGAAQVTSRSIQLGKSQASATDTQYTVKFTTPSGGSSNIGGVVVQFCANSPIVGIDCSSNAPAGFDLNETNLNVNGVVGLSGFSMNAATDTNTFIFTNATPQSVGASTAITINLGDTDQTETSPADGVTNPSSAGTFYARIITFDTQANAIAAAVSGDQAGIYTGAQDYAGVALSVNPVINVTALVQETLNFAVTGTSVTMGTGTPQIIDDTQQWISNAVGIDLDTNATTGLNIRLFGTDLVSGSNHLSGSATLGVLTGSTNSQFGICAKDSTNGQVVADAVYKTGAANCTTPGSSTFAWDNAATSATGGDTVYTSAGPVDDAVNSNVNIYYAARADNNVPAGQYQATHQLIATGTY